MSCLSDDRVVVALSGGVDSAVAAALLQKSGRTVLGCYLDFGHAGSCASDAADIARQLDISFEVVDAKKSFSAILDYFASQYASGRTPNPCGMCNRNCKFAALKDYADSCSAAAIATGHHVKKLPAGSRGIIARSSHREKDQTYALFNVPADLLGRCEFPVAELANKDAVRQYALDAGLSVADKPDSQDMCFAPDGDYEYVLRELAPQALVPGDILDADGNVLGRHRGVGLYTIGQRRGIGVATGEPAYVIEINAEENYIRLGPRPMSESDRLIASQANWHCDMPPGNYRFGAQVRYGQRAVMADLNVLGGSRFELRFDRPVHAITPGQAAVVYDGDVLLGGGWID